MMYTACLQTTIMKYAGQQIGDEYKRHRAKPNPFVLNQWFLTACVSE